MHHLNQCGLPGPEWRCLPWPLQDLHDPQAWSPAQIFLAENIAPKRGLKILADTFGFFAPDGGADDLWPDSGPLAKIVGLPLARL